MLLNLSYHLLKFPFCPLLSASFSCFSLSPSVPSLILYVVNSSIKTNLYLLWFHNDLTLVHFPVNTLPAKCHWDNEHHYNSFFPSIMPAGLQFVKYKLVEPLWMLDLINGRTQNVQAGQYSSWRQNDNYQTLQVICKQQMGVFPKLTNPTLQ